MPERSPEITHISWGKMEVAGLGRRRDFKLYPGGGRDRNWRETDTHHVPGIQPADVWELLENGREVIVLTRGHATRFENLLRNFGTAQGTGNSRSR